MYFGTVCGGTGCRRSNGYRVVPQLDYQGRVAFPKLKVSGTRVASKVGKLPA